jgi:hypothetical protein
MIGLILRNKPEAFAGLGGLIGAAVAALVAMRRYDFSVTDQMQRGVGYILCGLIMGALGGYFIGKSMKG